MPRPAVATIDLSAMRRNLAVARRCAPGAKTWAVVKANAYGHGLLRAARAFSASDGLALVEPDGAALLRQSGWNKPILLIEGCFDGDDVRLAVEHGLDTVVHSFEQIRMLRQTRPTRPVSAWIKLNTGMNRLGFPPDAFRKAVSELQDTPNVLIAGYLTHFANADDSDHAVLPVSEQMLRYEQAVAGMPGLRSLANSAAGLLHPEAAADWTRPGVMLYGGSPGGGSAHAFGLLPAMTFRSEVIGIQRIVPGDAVGYGSTFVADRAMTLAIVACGYADGYPRHAPAGAPIVLDGVRTRLVGRVSMDMLAADATGLSNVRIGSPVTLWGDGLPIDEVAGAAGTIGYELMCAIAPRVRVVERDGDAPAPAEAG